ncbi:TPA: hypothetical protein HA361_04840, partial [Candidatus Woesearchaeota archaeon]|nr:hypothetical protein [Candidatus Woesearchaeota archaeon]
MKKKRAKPKKVLVALAGKGICCSHRLSIERCTVGHGGWAAMQCTTEFSRAISPQAKGERTVENFEKVL